MITCAIIDDEPYARDLLKAFVARIPAFELAGSYSNALQAMSALGSKKIDLLFLDIQMPELSGVDFLKSLDKKPMVIFTTAFAEYAIEGFELDVVDYLLKPFDFQRFVKAANKVISKCDNKIPSVEERPAGDDFMFVKDGTRLVKVEFADILFVKGTREYVTIHTKTGKIMSLQTMKNLEHELPDGFIRVHNSFIVNIRAVDSIEKDDVFVGEEQIPVGATYKKNFLEAVKKYSKGT